MIRIIFGLVFLLTYNSLAFSQISMSGAAHHVRQGHAYLLRNQFEKAIRSFSVALDLKELSREKRAAILSDRGVARWRLKDYDNAIADFTTSLENKTEYPQALNNRGNVYLEMGKLEEAINDFTKAAVLAPDYGISYINRGNAYYLAKNFTLAKADFQTAMRLLPTQAIAYHGSGLSNIALGRQYAALRNLNRALILNKSYSSALFNRSKVYDQLDFPQKSLEDLSVSIRNNPDNHTILIKRARLRLGQKQYYAAINDAQKALKIAPGFVDAFIVRGMAYGKIKKFRAALKDLSLAIEDDPDRTETYIRRGGIYQRQGELEKAIIDLKTAQELDPKNAEIYKLLGQVSEANKEDEQALSHYRRALELDPLIGECRDNIKRLTGTLPPINGKQIGENLGKWKILDISVRDKEAKTPKTGTVPQVSPRYTLVNPDYPNFSAPVEMYGKGVPRLLEWTMLKKPLQGFGLLRYFAGYQDEDNQIAMEYIGIVNIRANSLVAVEPYKWGDKTAKWSWRQVSVVVTDPDSISSEVFLKKARKSRIASGASSSDNIGTNGFRASPKARAKARAQRQARKRKRRRRSRRKQKGIFDWLF